MKTRVLQLAIISILTTIIFSGLLWYFNDISNHKSYDKTYNNNSEWLYLFMFYVIILFILFQLFIKGRLKKYNINLKSIIVIRLILFSVIFILQIIFPSFTSKILDLRWLNPEVILVNDEYEVEGYDEEGYSSYYDVHTFKYYFSLPQNFHNVKIYGKQVYTKSNGDLPILYFEDEDGRNYLNRGFCTSKEVAKLYEYSPYFHSDSKTKDYLIPYYFLIELIFTEGVYTIIYFVLLMVFYEEKRQENYYNYTYR